MKICRSFHHEQSAISNQQSANESDSKPVSQKAESGKQNALQLDLFADFEALEQSTSTTLNIETTDKIYQYIDTEKHRKF